jgi:hypothetical protein
MTSLQAKQETSIKKKPTTNLTSHGYVEEEDHDEDQKIYEKVMRKIINSSQYSQGLQGQSSTRNHGSGSIPQESSIVEVLIDRMPTSRLVSEVTSNSPNYVETDAAGNQYMSPVAHAQRILNAYKAPKNM